MAGEIVGILCEDLCQITLEEIVTNEGLTSNIYRGKKPNWMTIKPDLVVGSDLDTPSHILLVTHAASAGETQKKFFRNVEEFFQIVSQYPGGIRPIPVSVIFGTTLEREWKPDLLKLNSSLFNSYGVSMIFAGETQGIETYEFGYELTNAIVNLRQRARGLSPEERKTLLRSNVISVFQQEFNQFKQVLQNMLVVNSNGNYDRLYNNMFQEVQLRTNNYHEIVTLPYWHDNQSTYYKNGISKSLCFTDEELRKLGSQAQLNTISDNALYQKVKLFTGTGKFTGLNDNRMNNIFEFHDSELDFAIRRANINKTLAVKEVFMTLNSPILPAENVLNNDATDLNDYINVLYNFESISDFLQWIANNRTSILDRENLLYLIDKRNNGANLPNGQEVNSLNSLRGLNRFIIPDMLISIIASAISNRWVIATDMPDRYSYSYLSTDSYYISREKKQELLLEHNVSRDLIETILTSTNSSRSISGIREKLATYGITDPDNALCEGLLHYRSIDQLSNYIKKPGYLMVDQKCELLCDTLLRRLMQIDQNRWVENVEKSISTYADKILYIIQTHRVYHPLRWLCYEKILEVLNLNPEDVLGYPHKTELQIYNNLLNQLHLSIEDEEINQAGSIGIPISATINNRRFYFKMIAAQSGNQSHKYKELAAQARVLKFNSDGDMNDTTLVLILDGEWNEDQIRQLYVAGWDIVTNYDKLGLYLNTL